MISHDEHMQRLNKEVAVAIERFYCCHGDWTRWQPWEFEAENKLIENVRRRVNREDGYA